VERAEFAGVFYDQEEKTYVIWDLNMQRTIGPATETKKVGEFELCLTGKSLNPNDLCYERVVVFQYESELVTPNTIIKPEFLRYLEPYAQPSGRWEPPHFVFDLPLRGDYTVPIKRRALFSRAEMEASKYKYATALNIWPDFRREGWHNYFIYFASTDPNIKLQALRVIGKDGNEITFTGITARGEIRFVPELIEITVADGSGTDYWSCYQVEFKDSESIPAATGTENQALIPILSLDFGTSNTCFAIKFSEKSRSEVVHFRNHTKQLIRGFSVEDSINIPWFPEIEEDHVSPSQLPSELSFYKETDKIVGEVKDLQPILHYAIPPFTRYREGEEGFIQGEFKWEHALPEGLKPSTYDLQFLYLTLAFRIALAEVVSDPRCQRLDQIDLVATCPLAFSLGQRENFRQMIGRVQAEIHKQTGVNLILQKMYDESHAGESGSGQMPGTVETIYVDVGGGTTDIGFFRFEERSDPPEERAVYLDSMQYAGDDVWSALTEGSLSTWGVTRFERQARAQGAAAIFSDPEFKPFQKQRNNSANARKGLKRFVDGLVEYIARMIAAREHWRDESQALEGELGLYLLGNGWRFIEVLNENDVEADAGRAIAGYVKTLVEKRLAAYKIVAPSLSVIYPIVKDRDPKTIVALGAIVLYVGEKAGDIPPEPEFVLKGFLGSDLVCFTPARQLIKWYESIPYELARGAQVRNLNYERPNEFDFESEQVDGTRIHEMNLLDHAVLSRQSGIPNITKNLIAFYLEYWHKRLLIRS
jgi:hypothetical protein